jgi:hypothetical protein
MTVMQPSDALSARLSEIGEIMASEWLDGAGEAGTAVLEAFHAN